MRQTLTLIVTVALSVSGGFWMDFVDGKYIGFVLLFLIAGGMGILEIILLALTPDGEPYQSSSQRCKLVDLVKIPLKDKCFTGFVLYILVFYLLLNISDSFTMVFMRKYLELPYKTVTLMYMVISLPQIFLLSVWGKLSDKFGHNVVLKTSIWLFAGETLFMTFASRQTCYFFIPLAFLTASVANAGFVISVFNRRYELMPKENRIVYDNFYTAAIGLGFVLGPMIGGGIKVWIESSPLIMNTMSNANIRLLYPVSTIGILVLQILYLYSLRKKERKEYVKN